MNAAPKTPRSLGSSTAPSTSTPATPGFWAVPHERARRDVEAWTARQSGSGAPPHQQSGSRPALLVRGAGRTATPVPAGVPLSAAATVTAASGLAADEAAASSASSATVTAVALEAVSEALEYFVTDVTFCWRQYGAPAPSSVCVTGSFTHWSDSIPLRRDPDDPRVWACTIALPAGKHQYKFVVDGVWRHAPDQPSVLDERGIINNTLTVAVEACGDESCFCARILREAMARKSESGGGADGSDANMGGSAGAAAAAERSADWVRRNALMGFFTPNTKIELKRSTGVALEYREKRRNGNARASARRVPQSGASDERRRSDGAHAVGSDGSQRRRMEAVRMPAAAPTPDVAETDGRCDAPRDGAEAAPNTSSRTHSGNDLERGSRPSSQSLLDNASNNEVTPEFSKTFMHHDVDDSTFVVTVAPDARELLMKARAPCQQSVWRWQRCARPRSSDTVGSEPPLSVAAAAAAMPPSTAGADAASSEAPEDGATPLNVDSTAHSSALGLDIPRGLPEHDNPHVMDLVTVAAASAVSSMHQAETAAEGGSGADTGMTTTSFEETSTKQTSVVSRSCRDSQRGRRHAAGRDGDDIIPEGAMSRVSSLSEIRLQHAQLAQGADVSPQAAAAAASLEQKTRRAAASDGEMGVADARRVDKRGASAGGGADSSDGWPIYRRNSAAALSTSQRPAFELQYAVRGEFSPPTFGFDPLHCHEDIALSNANQCAQLRPQYGGLYRTVMAVLPTSPGSYFEVVFAPRSDASEALESTVNSARRPLISSAILRPSKTRSTRPERAAACIGLVEEEAFTANALLGGAAHGIGLHTGGYVVCSEPQTGRVEWTAVRWGESVTEERPLPAVRDGAVIGVWRAAGGGVRFAVDGVEVMPVADASTWAAETFREQREWPLRFAATAASTESPAIRPAVSLFADAARVYAAFSHDALRYAYLRGGDRNSEATSPVGNLHCLDGEPVELVLRQP